MSMTSPEGFDRFVWTDFQFTPKSRKGGAGSGNYGHAGRPGEVGGSGRGPGFRIRMTTGGHAHNASTVREMLKKLPDQILAEMETKTLYVEGEMGEIATAIKKHLRDHYGIETVQDATGLVDRARGEVFAASDEARLLDQLSRTMTMRIESEEWQMATSKEGVDPEDAFAAAFTSLFTNKVAQEIMSATNPFTAMIENGPIATVLNKWGWKV